jgi:hypothetical protein
LVSSDELSLLFISSFELSQTPEVDAEDDADVDAEEDGDKEEDGESVSTALDATTLPDSLITSFFLQSSGKKIFFRVELHFSAKISSTS